MLMRRLAVFALSLAFLLALTAKRALTPRPFPFLHWTVSPMASRCRQLLCYSRLILDHVRVWLRYGRGFAGVANHGLSYAAEGVLYRLDHDAHSL